MVDLTLKDVFQTKIMISETGKNFSSFAKNIGISRSYLSQILGMKRNPSVAVANKIAKGLGVEVEEIFLVKNVANDNL